MNESSSKFVDSVAMHKLLSEKLLTVHHIGDAALNGELQTELKDISSAASAPSIFEAFGENGKKSFTSRLPSGDARNDQVVCELFPAAKERGVVIFVHGLYEDNFDIYRYFLINLNQRGLSVWVMSLPYHYERTPVGAQFSGEYFWSGDVKRSIHAFRQSAVDALSLWRYIKSQTGLPVWLVGFSMGGGVALSLASLVELDGAFVVNPVCNIADLVWHSKLFQPVKEDLVAGGFTFERMSSIYRQFEPLNVSATATPRDAVVLVAGEYDQINDPKNYQYLADQWKLENFIWYKAGHLNMLRVPRLAADVSRYYFKVMK